MDNIYGIVSSCNDYADKALMSPENLMMINPAEYNVYDHQHDHYQYHSMQNISNNLSSNNQYKTNYPPVFGQQDEFGFHCGVPSESVASMNVLNERKLRVDDHQDEQEYSNLIKAKIASHPWYPRLVNAYIECQKVGAPPEIASLLDEIRRDKDLCKNEKAKSMALGVDPELDEFMETFCDVLMKYKSDLSRPLDEASSFLSKIETQLNNIDKEDATFSSDEELSGGEEAETNLSSLDDPRNASKSEERELKNKLLLMYGGHIGNLKQEFSKKKKKGKLPKEARQALLQWWNVHFKWPYPTEADKISLGELTGLDQKQINNWFINQRKRHWKPSENMQLAIMDNISGNYFMD